MTKRIATLVLALLLTLTALSALAEEANGVIAIDRAHFPDAKFRGYIRQFDLNGNGKLSLAERRAVVSISVPYMDIVSLKGVEYFTRLRTLLVSSNKLRTLDVSKNKALTSLFCNFNRLTKLDVSRNVRLTELSCLYNRLRRLDVSGNRSLTKLNCQDNALRTLTLGRQSALARLRCTGNKLKALDIKHCPLLRAYLTEAPLQEYSTLVWGDDHQLVIDPTTRLTAGQRVLYP